MSKPRRSAAPTQHRYPRTARLNQSLREVLAEALTRIDDERLDMVTITSIDSRQDQTLITVSLGVLSIQEQTAGRPITSRWEFDWLESAEGWSLYKIRAIEVANRQAEQIQPMFPGRR